MSESTQELKPASSRSRWLIAVASLAGLFILSVFLVLHFLFKNDQKTQPASAATPSPRVEISQSSVPTEAVASPSVAPPDARIPDYGDKKSKSTDISSRPNNGDGLGTGKGGGIGTGEGHGIGPGEGGGIVVGRGGANNSGGAYHESGGGVGADYNKIFSRREVSSIARILSKPEPQYTEEARKNQIVGTVVLQAVFRSDGQVTDIRAVSGLPDGLTERAIAAARRIKFTPATRDGHAVSMYLQVEFNFNLY